MDKITTFLWFDGKAEEAARFYVGIFPDSRIDAITRTTVDYPGGREGNVLTVAFTLAGRSFQAMNGGPYATFSEAISLSIDCADQAEVDHYWTALSAHPDREQCGWLKDRYGLFWQVTPRILPELLAGPDREKARRVMEAMMAMRKLDVAAIERAAHS